VESSFTIGEFRIPSCILGNASALILVLLPCHSYNLDKLPFPYRRPPLFEKFFSVAFLLSSVAMVAQAQDCKLKFSVAYTDGQAIQVGLTPDQKKMWDHDGAKKFKGLCLDDKAPDYIVLWNQGLNGAELAKASVDHANVTLSTGEYINTTVSNSSVNSAYHYVRPSSAVRGKALYFILDTSKKPFPMIHQGEGYQDVPHDVRKGVDQSMDASDLASTIPDPVDALSNALKWLKKERKL
jgi:hypothetical protein